MGVDVDKVVLGPRVSPPGKKGEGAGHEAAADGRGAGRAAAAAGHGAGAVRRSRNAAAGYCAHTRRFQDFQQDYLHNSHEA